ncbi:MAG: hypothetical protein BWX84_01392 [Verrucomicrobia bacterium ADurb.Bin118]|jgi:hypothetical protein|nr:MAG: hypothetical protein BWX84_01392 [Verrucomicrobia bacterium ADurb.Bin118]
MKKQIVLAIATSLSLASTALFGQVLVNETFESYADTAAMRLNWDSDGLGTLDTDFGNPGQSATHPGGTVNTWIGSSFSLLPSSGTIVLKADIYDPGTGSAQRNTVGLRNGADPLFEMGHYNAQSSQYAVRVLAMYGEPNWVFFPGVDRTAGWHHYEATFTDTDVTITLDLESDGTVDSTLTFSGSPSANPFVDLRFGGPSGITSAGPMWVDNIMLSQIPEPSVAMLGLLGGFGLLAMFRRRR